MNVAIILAAGMSKRFGTDKMFVKIEKPLIWHTVKVFEENKNIDEIVVVSNNDKMNEVIGEFKKVKKIVNGGKTRQESCYNGVFAAEGDLFLVHDGARPFVTDDIINRSIKDANEYGISVVGVPCKDTIKIVKDGFVLKTLDRSQLFSVQTPQVFKADILKKAHEKAILDGFVGTDDTSLAERIGYKVKLTKGSYENIKITTKDDIRN